MLRTTSAEWTPSRSASPPAASTAGRPSPSTAVRISTIFRVRLTGANRHDSPEMAPTLDAIPPLGTSRRGRARQRPNKLHADKAYDAKARRQECRTRGIFPLIAPPETPLAPVDRCGMALAMNVSVSLYRSLTVSRAFGHHALNYAPLAQPDCGTAHRDGVERQQIHATRGPVSHRQGGVRWHC